jgi:hydrogenase/urease accessory protein HupE
MKPWRLAAVIAAVLLTMVGAASADIAFPMPPTCVESSPREFGASAGGFTSTWTVECQPTSLAGEAILIEGLLGTQTDLAFTLTTLDGRIYSSILRPSRPGFLVPEDPSNIALATEALISGLRRTVRHLSLWLVIAVAALIGQRPRDLAFAPGAFAVGHFVAQWLGGHGWLEVTPTIRDLLMWSTIAVPAIRLAGAGEGWKHWLQPLWPTALLLGLLFGGAWPEALPIEGLSNTEQVLALILFSVGSGAAVLLMTAAAHELTVLLALVADGRWDDSGKRVAGYLIGSLAVAMVVALLVGMWIGGGGGLRAPLEFAILAAILGPTLALIGRKGNGNTTGFLAFAAIGAALGLARVPLPGASLLTLGSLIVLGGALAVARPLGAHWALAVTVVAVSAHGWATAGVLVENVSRSTAVMFGVVLVAVCVFHASLMASRDLCSGDISVPVRLLGAFVAVLAVTWRLAEYRAWFELEVATEAALGLARLPLLSIGLVIVAVVWWVRSRRTELPPEPEQRPHWRHRLAFVGAFLLLPYGTLAVPNPFFAAYAPRGEGARLIMSKVLSDTYQALNIEDEEELYDALAESVTGDLIGDLYLDNRRRLTAGTRQGTEVTIRGVSVLEIGEPTEIATAAGGYSYDCQWAVVARVQHLQHVHHRRQIYSGVLTLRAEEGRWKVAEVELFSEDRVVLPWDPT